MAQCLQLVCPQSAKKELWNKFKFRKFETKIPPLPQSHVSGPHHRNMARCSPLHLLAPSRGPCGMSNGTFRALPHTNTTSLSSAHANYYQQHVWFSFVTSALALQLSAVLQFDIYINTRGKRDILFQIGKCIKKLAPCCKLLACWLIHCPVKVFMLLELFHLN